MIKSFLNKTKNSFLNLFYPSFCLHCQSYLKQSHSILCDQCIDQMELLNLRERCRYCFSDENVSEHLVCLNCYKKSYLHEALIAAFEYQGPPVSLIQQLKYGNKPYLAKGCGAYMAMQLVQSYLPIPDLIVPVPMMLTHWLVRGYNQSALLAESIGELIERPVVSALKRKSGAYSQAGLKKEQRILHQEDEITLKNPSMITDRIILLVDDVITTGHTFSKCTEVLMEASPSKVYLQAFCRAD